MLAGEAVVVVGGCAGGIKVCGVIGAKVVDALERFVAAGSSVVQGILPVPVNELL